VPGGEIRGGHAFREQQEIIVAISGSFDVIVDDGVVNQTSFLNRSLIVYLGYNSRLDEIQAAFLSIKVNIMIRKIGTTTKSPSII